jgi:hypothetical protein
LALELVRHHIREELLQLFVAIGGFGILREWLSDAIDSREISLIIAIVKLCRFLPFDYDAIRSSEIAGLIHSLRKYESKNTTRLTKLHSEVQSIKEEWRDKHQLASALNKSEQQEQELQQQNNRKQPNKSPSGPPTLDTNMDVVEEVDLLSAAMSQSGTPRSTTTPTTTTSKSAAVAKSPLLSAMLNQQPQPSAFSSSSTIKLPTKRVLAADASTEHAPKRASRENSETTKFMAKEATVARLDQTLVSVITAAAFAIWSSIAELFLSRILLLFFVCWCRNL